MTSAERKRRQHYAAVWRWHFLSGLVVVPFFLMAAITGTVMVLKTPVAELMHRDRLVVEAGGERLPPSALVEAATTVVHGEVRAYLAPDAPDRSAIIYVMPAHGGPSHAGHGPGGMVAVYVDPYTGAVLDEAPLGQSLADLAERMHGTLLLGTVGDVVIEVLAGFGILMIGTGIYLYWPTARQPTASSGRARWRCVHGVTGWSISAALLFFLVSGLAWTPIWGGKVVQAWGAFPSERFAAPTGEARHEALNAPSARIVPWVLEKTPMPQSSLGTEQTALISLDDVVGFAERDGFTGYRVLLPRGEGETFTISATTMAGDVTDPRKDRTVHIDPVTGIVLADMPFKDYSLGGKVMAESIPFHSGQAGAWNVALNLVACLAVVLLAASGIVMGWRRRPAGRMVTAPAAGRAEWRRVTLLLLGVSVLFPATAVVLATIMVIDAFVRTQRQTGRGSASPERSEFKWR
ncbi:MAG: PepSY domain-containing protein [Parvularcula sp.]|jgi:uncharacterized iron-regulated membrane protein|nr:PepSY domain-containing protein [Parvularcula sp.]